MSWLLDGRPLSRILVTRLRYLGDVVMSTSVLRALRRGAPELRLGFLCESSYTTVLSPHPELQRVHALAAGRRGPDARARGAGPGAGRGSVGMIRELASARYELAVDLFFNPRSAWLLRLAGVEHRIGGARSWRRRLYTHTVDTGEALAAYPAAAARAPGGLGHHLARLAPLEHAETGQPFLEWMAGQHSADFAPALDPACGDGDTAASTLAEAGLDPNRPYLLLAPGATWPSKEWPVSCWSELIGDLRRNGGHQLVVLRPPVRGDMWGKLAASLPPGEGAVLPPLALPAVLGLLVGACGLVTVDGGVMHAGVALKVPTVAIFGPTDAAIWFPYAHLGPYGVVLTAPACHPCDLHDCDAFVCLPDLAPRRVGAEVLRLLGARS